MPYESISTEDEVRGRYSFMVQYNYCTEQFEKATIVYYNIILFKSCDLQRLDTIDILRTKIVMSLNFYIC
jgi:hypothetical protein